MSVSITFRGNFHADESFTWTGLRFRQFSYGEDVVGVAGAFKNKRFHKRQLSWRRNRLALMPTKRLARVMRARRFG